MFSFWFKIVIQNWLPHFKLFMIVESWWRIAKLFETSFLNILTSGNPDLQPENPDLEPSDFKNCL